MMKNYNLNNNKERKKFIIDFISMMVKDNNGETEILFDNNGITKIIITFERGD